MNRYDDENGKTQSSLSLIQRMAPLALSTILEAHRLLTPSPGSIEVLSRPAQPQATEQSAEA